MLLLISLQTVLRTNTETENSWLFSKDTFCHSLTPKIVRICDTC